MGLIIKSGDLRSAKAGKAIRPEMAIGLSSLLHFRPIWIGRLPCFPPSLRQNMNLPNWLQSLANFHSHACSFNPFSAVRPSYPPRSIRLRIRPKVEIKGGDPGFNLIQISG